ncbi:MAG: DUF348 domain-containing protein [Candidatus Moranbacteria bacterium]|nr:DUF348 domain-containing protein [Candidatus Moranbacteria bacterium]
MSRKRTTIISAVILGSVAIASFFIMSQKTAHIYGSSAPKFVSVVVDGFPMSYPSVTELTVGGFIDGLGMDISSRDDVFPSRDVLLSSGMNIIVNRLKTVSIRADGETREIKTNARTSGEALMETDITLREEDLVAPAREALLSRSEKITVTRVEIREESTEKKIAFETKTKEDDTLSWRKKVTEQKGEYGIRTYRYRVSYHDGKEVSRKLLGSEVTKEPVTEIVVQGTYVKTGKAVRGMGTWYSYTGKRAAASLSLPLGSYARVTNPANGKSVIVVINDRGPYGKGRIIDLDKVAFEEIASLGAGVIDVKVELVLN